MTDASSQPRALMTEILRRSAHEIRNSLNGVAVNVEVVRSRATRAGGAGEVSAFAERAVSEVATTSALMEATLALAQGFVDALSDGAVSAGRKNGAGDESFTVSGAGPHLERLSAAVSTLGPRIGARAESDAKAVIFTVLPESSSHSPA